MGMWMSVSLPLIMGISAKILMNRADTVMLGPLSTFDQVGYYGAAFRLTYLLTFPQVVLATIIAPVYSAAIAKNDAKRLRHYFMLALAFSASTSLPIVAGIFPFRHEIIELIFGLAFLPASDALAILTLGQTAAALTIPMTALLMVSGRERIFGLLNLVGLALNISLNFWWIPKYGAVGASWAGTACSLFLLATSVYLTIQTIHRLQHSKSPARC